MRQAFVSQLFRARALLLPPAYGMCRQGMAVSCVCSWVSPGAQVQLPQLLT